MSSQMPEVYKRIRESGPACKGENGSRSGTGTWVPAGSHHCWLEMVFRLKSTLPAYRPPGEQKGDQFSWASPNACCPLPFTEGARRSASPVGVEWAGTGSSRKVAAWKVPVSCRMVGYGNWHVTFASMENLRNHWKNSELVQTGHLNQQVNKVPVMIPSRVC